MCLRPSLMLQIGVAKTDFYLHLGYNMGMGKSKYVMNSPLRMPEGSDVNTMKAEASAYLQSENRKHTTRAKNIGRKNCQRCGYCCLLQPRVPAPVI